jgi:hypothetical protein
MRRRNLVLAVTGGLIVAATALTGATVWLLVTAPATVASAVSSREMLPLVQMVVGVLYQALLRLAGYLVQS